MFINECNKMNLRRKSEAPKRSLVLVNTQEQKNGQVGKANHAQILIAPGDSEQLKNSVEDRQCIQLLESTIVL